MSQPFARIFLSEGEAYDMLKTRIIIGRKSMKHDVDIEVGPSAYVSRHHLEIYWKTNSLRLKCKGKNGIFINKKFQSYGFLLHFVPSRCTLRFPNTSICIKVQQCFLSLSTYLPTKKDVHIHSKTSKKIFLDLPENCIKQVNEEVLNLDLDCYFDDTLSYTNQIESIGKSSRTRRKQSLIPYNRSLIIESNNEYGKKLDAAFSEKSNYYNHELCLNEDCISRLSSLDPATIPKIKTNIETTTTSNPSNLILAMNNSPLCTATNPWISGKCHLNGQFGSPIHASGLALAHPSASPNNHQLPIVSDHWGGLFTKPPYSYAQLISQAIVSQPDNQITLNKIYEFISQNYPYYQLSDKGWQNSVRHNLSLNRQFIKVPRMQDHGKGCFWRIDPLYETKLTQLAFRKRRSRAIDNHNFAHNSLVLKDSKIMRNYFQIPKSLLEYSSGNCTLTSLGKVIPGRYDDVSDEIKKIQFISTSLQTPHTQIPHNISTNLPNALAVHHIFNNPDTIRRIQSPVIRILSTKNGKTPTSG